jgi:3-deoxy-7-phosphoheptulonate synthase
LDVNAIALVKQTTDYPVIADPSHGTGRTDLVLAASRAAVAAGADGLLVEFHPDPAAALSDGDQTLPLESLPYYRREIARIARALGRGIC